MAKEFYGMNVTFILEAETQQDAEQIAEKIKNFLHIQEMLDGVYEMFTSEVFEKPYD